MNVATRARTVMPMPDPDDNNKPLVNDPAREAVATMRGYSYQVLCSVLAWINIPEGEVLYLEGAEDLDQVYGDDATTTQVKDTRGSGNVTLRSAGALEAIDNYWSHKQRNPERRIRLHYLTTSEIGTEKGDPFGRKLPGIELWRRAKKSDDLERKSGDLAAIKAFLIEQDGLSDDLKSFLGGCSADELLTDLIEPINWDTGAGDSSDVRTEILAHLIEFGADKQVPVRDAEAVIGHLYDEAWVVATRDHDRKLDRVSFIRVFDAATQISIPKSHLSALVAQITPDGETGAPLPAIVGNQRAISLPPPIPTSHYKREGLLTMLEAASGHNSVVILQGST
ncbi:MAG: hypothetical protein QF521_21585, partial [Alphaproteobacteria bacterium]|nr:hypothetical protein [Alphaproteobacteria bacterium]